MISDLTHFDAPASSGMVLAALAAQPVQPVTDVATYITNRRALPHYQFEENLLITLPKLIQKEVKALVRACVFVKKLVTGAAKMKVEPACLQALAIPGYAEFNWHLKTFRAKYDLWAEKQDWLVLVNRAKAKGGWKKSNAGLPAAFLKECETRFAGNNRGDGKRQALLSLKRQWKTGRTDKGVEAAIPGYEADWAKRSVNLYPDGWHYSNITRQIKARGRFTKAVQALSHDSESSARQFLPQHLGDRSQLRFLEKVTFDDVRMDWLVFNAETGKAEELWLLVARDEATAMVLGFVMHPATVREDGSASHLGAQQMKELCAYLLERYPLPPYTVHWIVERGTATLAEAVKDSLGELFNNRIKVHYTSMIGDKSPVGYKEKAKGNSRGKGSHEAHNRLFHTQSCGEPGQIGAHYGIRPADLQARVKECGEIWELRQRLPEHKRGDVRFPLTVLQTEAREVISRYCVEQNFRTEHKLQGFDQVLEWYDAKTGNWQPRETAPPGVTFRPRMEMPVERAINLIRSVERWDKVDPTIIQTFLEHTQRWVEVNAKGEIAFDHQRKTLIYKNAGVPLKPGTRALAYHHSDDPQFLHLTSGDGCVLGTWAQRGRGAFQDQEALAAAMRYTHAAREEAKAVATELAAPRIAELAAMREHNATLANDFVVTAEVPAALGTERGTPIGTMLASVATTERAAKRAEAKRQSNLEAFRGDVADLATPAPAATADTADDFGAEELL